MKKKMKSSIPQREDWWKKSSSFYFITNLQISGLDLKSLTSFGHFQNHQINKISLESQWVLMTFNKNAYNRDLF
jgi:hypothetical protein